MESMWFHWLLVVFLCKSIALADVEVSVVNGTDCTVIREFVPTYTHCPISPNAHGIYTLQLGSLDPFEVSCDAEIAGPGWTVIARRIAGGPVFRRGWADYKKGFGDIRGGFFIGLDKLHAITKAQPQELYVYLKDSQGSYRHAKYDEFFIESENELYRMSKLGGYTGTAGDSLTASRNMSFTTMDRDNDKYKDNNCASFFNSGPWWHGMCTSCNLFTDINFIFWNGFSGKKPFKVAQMMLRPKCTCCTM